MATVRYTVINGQIIAEKRNGVRKFYSSDALGSTVALYSGLTKTDAFTYWLYGETRTRTGSTPTKYKFVGTLGCREQADGGIYMRARVEQPEDGKFTSIDPFWPIEPAYSYVRNSPVSYADPSGASWPGEPDVDYIDCPKDNIFRLNFELMCKQLVRCCKDSECRQAMMFCWGMCGSKDAESAVDCMCKHCDGTYSINFGCDGPECRCHPNWCAYTYEGTYFTDCSIFMCAPPPPGCAVFVGHTTLLHELSHCCGSDDHKNADAYCIAPCIDKLIRPGRR